MIKGLLYILFFCVVSLSLAQGKNGDFIYEVVDGDTIPILVTLEEVEVHDEDYWREWRRTVYFTQRMYPYAKIIDSVTHEIDSVSETYEKKREQKKYMKQKGKELREEFDLEIREMSITRGKYLELLVYRETGSSIYDLIKKYKNGRQAFFWHMILKIYGGTSLKEEYDPENKHQMLADVIKKIEKGEILIIPRSEQKAKLLRELDEKK